MWSASRWMSRLRWQPRVANGRWGRGCWGHPRPNRRRCDTRGKLRTRQASHPTQRVRGRHSARQVFQPRTRRVAHFRTTMRWRRLWRGWIAETYERAEASARGCAEASTKATSQNALYSIRWGRESFGYPRKRTEIEFSHSLGTADCECRGAATTRPSSPPPNSLQSSHPEHHNE